MFQFFIGNISARVKIKTGFFNQPFQEPADDWTFAVGASAILGIIIWFTTSEKKEEKNAHFAAANSFSNNIITFDSGSVETDEKKFTFVFFCTMSCNTNKNPFLRDNAVFASRG